MFLRNAWYVAAWDFELGSELMPITVLGERIVLYRKRDGTPAALEDACPHRKLPLSMGRIKGDDVECDPCCGFPLQNGDVVGRAIARMSNADAFWIGLGIGD